MKRRLGEAAMSISLMPISAMPRREIVWYSARAGFDQTNCGAPSYQEQAGAAKPVAGRADAAL
jgi:hypothetical protein